MFGSSSNKNHELSITQPVVLESIVGSAPTVSQHSPEDFFEGSEKLLEIWFSFDAKLEDKKSSLRCIPRFELDRMLEYVNATIVSTISSDQWDAYVLSESSLFIADDRLILKTCGNTTLLLGLEYLIGIVFRYTRAIAIKNLYYSRKSFLRPEYQKYPHKNFESENNYLKTLFPSGSRIQFDLDFNDKWYVFVYENVDGASDIIKNLFSSAKYKNSKNINNTACIDSRDSANTVDAATFTNNILNEIINKKIQMSNNLQNSMSFSFDFDSVPELNSLMNEFDIKTKEMLTLSIEESIDDMDIKSTKSENKFIDNCYNNSQPRFSTLSTSKLLDYLSDSNKNFNHNSKVCKLSNINDVKCISDDDYSKSSPELVEAVNSNLSNSDISNDNSYCNNLTYNSNNSSDTNFDSIYGMPRNEIDSDCSLSDKKLAKNDNTDQDDDFTIELLMNKLHQYQSSLFYKGPNYLGDQMTKQTGIDTLMKDAIYDSTEFDPCGYSMNSLLDDKYQTIHVTPQDSYSYASYETNQEPSSSIESCYKAVTHTFCPETFLLTAFLTKNDEKLYEFEEMLSGKYKKVCHCINTLKRHSVHCLQFIKI